MPRWGHPAWAAPPERDGQAVASVSVMTSAASD
jgi:hypothetical protein